MIRQQPSEVLIGNLIHLFPTTHHSQLILPCSNGTRDAGPFEATVALRHLLQVLLVVVLSVVKLLPLKDLGSDGAKAFLFQLLETKSNITNNS